MIYSNLPHISDPSEPNPVWCDPILCSYRVQSNRMQSREHRKRQHDTTRRICWICCVIGVFQFRFLGFSKCGARGGGREGGRREGGLWASSELMPGPRLMMTWKVTLQNIYEEYWFASQIYSWSYVNHLPIRIRPGISEKWKSYRHEHKATFHNCQRIGMISTLHWFAAWMSLEFHILKAPVVRGPCAVTWDSDRVQSTCFFGKFQAWKV